MNVLVTFTHTCTVCMYMYLHVPTCTPVQTYCTHVHVHTCTYPVHTYLYTYTCICPHFYTHVCTPCSTVLLEVRIGTAHWFTTTRGWPITKPVERPSLYKRYRTYSPRYRQRWPHPLYSRNGRSKHSQRRWTFGPSENRYDSSHITHQCTHSYNRLNFALPRTPSHFTFSSLSLSP